MTLCIFCDTEFEIGSEEHVIPSSLGGRITTREATCSTCNNSFSNAKDGAAEVCFAHDLRFIRNGLNIWSGRNTPPPNIINAGKLEDGAIYDLAPYLIPIIQKGRIPPKCETENISSINLTAANQSDAKRIIETLEKRKLKLGRIEAKSVTAKIEKVQANFGFDCNKAFTVISKIAIVSYVRLYGNEKARRDISKKLREAVRYGTHNVADFCGWDYVNEKPRNETFNLSKKTDENIISGFEHKVIFTSIGNKLVAYITIFGGLNFSVLMGNVSDVEKKGFAINPTLPKLARFDIEFESPKTYTPRNANSFKDEHKLVWKGMEDTISKVMAYCYMVQTDKHVKALTEELQFNIENAKEEEINSIFDDFSHKVACIECGLSWEEKIVIK